jgi:hypothetical protein
MLKNFSKSTILYMCNQRNLLQNGHHLTQGLFNQTNYQYNKNQNLKLDGNEFSN